MQGTKCFLSTYFVKIHTQYMPIFHKFIPFTHLWFSKIHYLFYWYTKNDVSRYVFEFMQTRSKRKKPACLLIDGNGSQVKEISMLYLICTSEHSEQFWFLNNGEYGCWIYLTCILRKYIPFTCPISKKGMYTYPGLKIPGRVQRDSDSKSHNSD